MFAEDHPGGSPELDPTGLPGDAPLERAHEEPISPEAEGIVQAWDAYDEDRDAFAADYAAMASLAREGKIDALLDTLRSYRSRHAASVAADLKARLAQG